MPWFRVDDTFAFHGKVVAAGNAALGLWVRAGAWSAQTLTGGKVPDHVVAALGGTRTALTLCSAGLWTRVEGGYQFHDWEKYQPTKESVEAERESARDRQRRAREKAKSLRDTRTPSRVTNGVSHASVTPEVTVPPSLPIPTHIKEPSSADADALFEAFWDLYPKKVEKQAAKRKWDTTVKRVDPEDILAGLRRYVAWWKRKGTERQWIKGPEVWLNKGCWTDELDDDTPEDLASSGHWFPGA